MGDYLMLVLFTLMLGGLGLMLMIVGAREIVTQRKLVANAETVEARILSARVVASPSMDTDARVLRSNSTTSHTPEVRFEYAIEGVRYESDLLYPSIIHRGYASEEAAALEIAEYEAGATTLAYVDASMPERGFLRMKSSSGPVWFIVAGLLSFAMLALLQRFI